MLEANKRKQLFYWHAHLAPMSKHQTEDRLRLAMKG
jgi:hypothetical protein